MDVNLALSAATSGVDAAQSLQSAQVGLLKKAMDSQSNVAAKMLASMQLPLATDGRLGTKVNMYA